MPKPNPTTIITDRQTNKPRVSFIRGYFTTLVRLFLVGLVIFIIGLFVGIKYPATTPPTVLVNPPSQYWLVLYRNSNIEQLFQGQPGDYQQSRLANTFKVKTGIPLERPTPLPRLVGREYWLITKKYASSENPETAPYFLELDVPGIEQYPFGPVPYLECHGQCNWQLPGAFGLHGINSDLARLSAENPGSSGCIRHTDEDITYLYNLLDLNQPVRYYVEEL